jgi:hypothetical protein
MKTLILLTCTLYLNFLSSFGNEKTIVLEGKQFDIIFNCVSRSLDIKTKTGIIYQVSAPDKIQSATIESQTDNEVVINYSEIEKRITLKLDDESLRIRIESGKNDHFRWPNLTKFNALTIPFHQGKYIPANDSIWINYLNGRDYSGLEDLSMQFFATSQGEKAILYFIDNKFNNEIYFGRNKYQFTLAFEHEFPSTVSKREYGFTVKIIDNSTTSIAKEYQKYVLETTGIKTLEEKAKTNPNIRKLYGAANFYVWSQEFLSTENIKWDGLIKFWISQTSEKAYNPTKHIFALLKNDQEGTGVELFKIWNDIQKNKYVNIYQKSLILRSLNAILSSPTFYSKEAWKNTYSSELSQMLTKDLQQPNETEIFQLNKQAFYAAFKPYLEEIGHWGDGVSIDILKKMSSAGIKKAWMGLNEWKPALINPDFVKTANEMGYLISPYDDYHGIHEPGNERWNTAAFDDPGLYESATVTNKNGTKNAAFLGIGRKFNPTLAFPSVKKRVEGILNQGIQFNSWFIDCDGTGEFLDDYSPGRITSQEDDMNARLKRLAWIGNEKNMVVGTEVGNDFCADVIAYAHGMTTPVIEWSDPDMRKNKDSEYYLGDYYSANGGIPSKFSKEVKIKPLYEYVYLDNRFNLPLFQLVYNNSVITSHHWEWGTLKIPKLVKEREIQEILYNIPPMYHIDRKEWTKHKTTIINHAKQFCEVHQKAVRMEMLSFDILDENRNIQITRFGADKTVKIELLANFSNKSFIWNEWNIPTKAILISDKESGTSHIYMP